MIAQFAIQGAMMGALPQQQGGPPWQAMVGGGAIGLVFGLVLAAIMLPIAAFISAGIYHICLMLFGGANRPYETTFRVYCYAYGTTALISMIPFCGGYIQAIVALVFTGIGLCYAHNTDGWRAVLAVIAPTVCCVGLAIGLLVLIFGSLAAAGAGGGGNFGPGVQPQPPFDPNQFNIQEQSQLLPQASAPTCFESFDPFAPSNARVRFSEGFAQS